MSLHQEKFVPSSFFNRFVDQKTCYFEACEKCELVNPILVKVNASLSYY